MKRFCVLAAISLGVATTAAYAQGGGAISIEQARRLIAAAETFGDGQARAFTKELPSSRSCCSPFDNFNFTGVLTVAPSSGGTACFNCVPSVPDNDIGIKFPTPNLFRLELASSTMSFASRIPGTCTAAFLWFNPAINQTIAGSTLEIDDCGSNNLWLVEFFDFAVPNSAAIVGNNLLIGVIVASNGTVKTDFQNFIIE